MRATSVVPTPLRDVNPTPYQLSWASRLTRVQGRSRSLQITHQRDSHVDNTSYTHILADLSQTPYQLSQPLLAISRIISSRVGLQTRTKEMSPLIDMDSATNDSLDNEGFL